jgi:hypothetical protein
MNQSDIEMIEKEVRQLQLNPAVAYALMRIQHDLSVMMAKIDRIEDALAVPPNGWDIDGHDDPRDPPF